MRKKTKATPIRAVKIMRLEFFANRFGINKKELMWGIITTSNEDAQESKVVVILLRHEKNLFIDIVNDRIAPLIHICGCKSSTRQAKQTRTSGGYVFTADKDLIMLKDSEIEELYKNKLYSENLSKQAESLQ